MTASARLFRLQAEQRRPSGTVLSPLTSGVPSVPLVTASGRARGVASSGARPRLFQFLSHIHLHTLIQVIDLERENLLRGLAPRCLSRVGNTRNTRNTRGQSHDHRESKRNMFRLQVEQTEVRAA